MFLFISLTSSIVWYKPHDGDINVIQNQGFSNEISSYARFPSRAEKLIRKEVYDLSQQSSGLAIYFYTNSSTITIHYDTSVSTNYEYLSKYASTGIDLYAKDMSGYYHMLVAEVKFGKTCEFKYSNINSADRYEFRLMLPNFNIISNLEIGIEDKSQFLFIRKNLEFPIVVYGTSIAQGASSNRAGISWTSLVSRQLEYPVQNYGFMSQGLLEPAVIDLIIQNEARVYVLDCLPDLITNEKKNIKNLLINAVKQIRANRTTPILLNDFAGLANAFANEEEMNKVKNCNNANQEAYNELISSGIKDLYIQHFNFSYDSWIDTIHPLDIGMRQQANDIIKTLVSIFDVPSGNLSTQKPVTQNFFRQPNDWINRHFDIINWSRTSKPRSVIIGDSITNMWGGNPPTPVVHGQSSWNKYFEPKGFINLGIGTDKIENALWRIYHDEFTDNQFERICILIGTNNFVANTNEEILEGLKFLCKEIRNRQSKANIKVLGILPRRSMEERVVDLNKMIKIMAEEDNYMFINPGTLLLLENGKIDENLFVDGLHPNEEGYMRIAEIVSE